MRVPFFTLVLVAMAGVAPAADFEFTHENVLGTSLELQISALSAGAVLCGIIYKIFVP